MPQNNNLAVVRYAHPFCNDIILALVRDRLLSESYARKITVEQFESSALSEPFVLNLIYQRKMSSIRALSINRETYLNSALPFRDIQILVDREVMSIDRALSIQRDEVENPVPYLTELGDRKTPEQMRRLFLYESNPGITPEYVEHIIALEFQKNGPDFIDERELELLLDPSLRRYATYIVNLEFFSEKNKENSRELELILSHHSRSYFNLIVDLEFKENKSVDEEIYLENLYLRVCCKLPRKNPIFSLFQSALHDEIGPQGCHEQMFFGPGYGFNMTQHDASERRQMEQMKAVIERAAKEIVMVELDVRGVPVKLRETEVMQKYVFGKTDLLRHALMKYFVGHQLPYSQTVLDTVKEKIIQRINDKSLTLSHVDKLSSLRGWIDEVAESCKPD